MRFLHSGAQGVRLAQVTNLSPNQGSEPPKSVAADWWAAGPGGQAGPYAALDLGTNNCRLLVARPTMSGFRVIDAFSRIVRLGEGLSHTGRLSDAAIARTLDALCVCRDKMRARGVKRSRLIATEACRSAENGEEFVALVRERIGLELEIVDRETEARLAAAGAGELADRDARSIVMFDIGGGSSEIIWLGPATDAASVAGRVRAWESLRLGVVSLAERFGGEEVSEETFAAMTTFVSEALEALRGARRRRGALRAFPPARNVGHGDHGRRRPSQSAPLRPPRWSTASG